MECERGAGSAELLSAFLSSCLVPSLSALVRSRLLSNWFVAEEEYPCSTDSFSFESSCFDNTRLCFKKAQTNQITTRLETQHVYYLVCCLHAKRNITCLIPLQTETVLLRCCCFKSHLSRSEISTTLSFIGQNVLSWGF